MKRPFILQVIGYKNRGKTTVISNLVQIFSRRGFRVGTIKHASHSFDVDHPGTDSWKHKEAGAHIVAISSPVQTAVIERRTSTLDELLERMQNVDIVFVEGFKRSPYPKLVIVKEPDDVTLLTELEHVIGMIFWGESLDSPLPQWSINSIDEMAEWLFNYIKG